MVLFSGKFDTKTVSKSECEQESGRHIPKDAAGAGAPPNMKKLANAYFPLEQNTKSFSIMQPM